MAEGEALRELYVRFAAEVEGAEELDKLDASAGKAKHGIEATGESAHKTHGLFKGLREGIEGIAAVFIGSELFSSIKETAHELAGIADLSIQTGIAAENIEFFGYVVGQAGGNAKEFQGQLNVLQRSLSKTEKATSPQAAALKSLGIATDDAEGNTRSLNDVLPEIFANFGNVTDANEQAAIAQKLFGRSGLALLQALREGKGGLEEYREQFEELGGAAPEAALASAKAFGDAIERQTTAFNRLKVTLFVGVLPRLTDFVDTLAKTVGKMSKFLEGTTAGEHAILGLAAVLAGPLLKALGPFLGKGLKFLAIYAAVDDLLAFLEGKDSLIGRLLDAAFGDGTATAARAWVLDVIHGFQELSANGVSISHAIEMAWGDTLNSMFQGFNEFVLGAENLWNDLVSTLHLPDSFKIDTKDAQGRIDENKRIHSAYEQEAYDSTHPKEVAMREQEKQRAYDENNGTGRRDTPYVKGSARAAFASPAADDAPRAPGGYARGFGLTGGAVPSIENTPRVMATAAPEFTMPLPSQSHQNTTLTDNRSITLLLKESAGDSVRQQVKQAVQEAFAKDDPRTTMQQVAQRGEKKGGFFQ